MHNFSLRTLITLVAMTATVSGQGISTISFQNGINGYNGTVDRRISSNLVDESDGIDAASYFMDGWNNGNSPDTQNLIRFDDIVGTGPNQIPVGATILNAELIFNTSVRGNAQTGGPYGVAALLSPFEAGFTSYDDYESNPDAEAFTRGPWWQDDSATRPVAGFGFQTPGNVTSANVTNVVQAWTDNSLENHGFTVQAGRGDLNSDVWNTTDGWAIRTTGYPVAEARPELKVEYTTADITISSFQEGVNDYAGTTMALVRSGRNALLEDTNDLENPERTEDGLDLFEPTFLDGIQFDDIDGNTSSPDDFALLKFDNVFGTEAGLAPAELPIAKAWAVITTGDNSASSRTVGPWTAHTVNVEWDTTTLHSSFGEVNGLQISEGEISPALDTQSGFIRGAEVWFDVTDMLEGVRTGADNNGLAILSKATADGWQINTNGSDFAELRPRLVVYSGLATSNPADCNGDGVVDAMDLACSCGTGSIDAVLAETSLLRGDLDGDGTVAFQDFVTLSSNFGQPVDSYSQGDLDCDGQVAFQDFVTLSSNFGKSSEATAAAVPEPATGLLAGLGSVIALLAARKRR